MEALVKDVKSGDHLLFHYAGHGGQKKAEDNENEGEDRVGKPGERDKMRELEVGADVISVVYRVDSVSDVGHGRESRPATRREDLRRSSTSAEKKRGKSRRRRRHA